MWVIRLDRLDATIGSGPFTGDNPDVRERTPHRPAARSLLRLAAIGLIACSAVSACTSPVDIGSDDLEEETEEPVVEGMVTVGEEPVPHAKARFIDTSDESSMDAETMDDGNYVIELKPGVEYESFAFDAPGAFCPEHRFVAPDDGKVLDFDCTLAAGPVQLAYEPTTNTCAQPVEGFTADYSLITEVVGAQTLIDFEHVDAPTLSGEYDDESRTLTASTGWIDVGNNTEVRETIEVGLAYVIQANGTIDSYWSLNGFSILDLRSTVTSAACLINSDLVVRPAQ